MRPGGPVCRSNDAQTGKSRLSISKTGRSPSHICIASYVYSSILNDDLPGTDAQTDVLYQDNHLAYDALNRLRVAGNNEANVSIHYDRVGNRSRIETNVFTLPHDEMQGQGQTTHQQHQTFTYDAMNRQTSVQTSFDSG